MKSGEVATYQPSSNRCLVKRPTWSSPLLWHVALDRRRSVGDLRLQRRRLDHRLLEIWPVDGQREVRCRRLEALDVGQAGARELDEEGLARVGRHEVHGEAQAFGLAAVHADAEKFKKSSVDITGATSGLVEFPISPCAMPDCSS